MNLGDVPFSELVDRSETCPGREVYFLKRRVLSSYHIFAGNSKELKKVLSSLADPASAQLRWQRNRQKHDLIMREVGRLLHNYACSIESLGCHVRAIMRKAYREGELRELYDSMVDEVFHSPFAQFMQDLRDWATHRGMLPFGDRVDLEIGQGTVVGRKLGIVLDIDDLRKWKGWKAKSKAYLASLTVDRLEVLALVKEYDQLVHDFYGELDGTIERAHSTELSEFRSVVDEIGRRLAGRDKKTN